MNLLKKLIQIHSVSGSEKEIQQFIFDYFFKKNLQPFYVGENVVVKIDGNDNKKSLIFNAHVDTISAGNTKLWKYPPFAGVKTNGKIYGVGASDSKAGIATLMMLGNEFKKNKPKCDIWLTFVVKEETDGSGTKNFINLFTNNYKKQYKEIAGILLEPTNLSKIEIAHKGNVFLKVITYGDSGHGSAPELVKENAINIMQKVAKKLLKLEKEWKKEYEDSLLGSPSIALFTSLHAGDPLSPNKIPETCVATFDIRTTPKMHKNALEMVKKEIKEKNIEVFTKYKPLECGFTSPNARIVTITKSSADSEICASSSSNDLLFFTKAEIPAVVFGPGNTNEKHKVNEFCEIKNLIKAKEIYKEIIQKF